MTTVIFYFHNAENKELPVIKIFFSDEGREDCQQLKPKGTQASLGTTACDSGKNSSYSFNFV